MKTTLLFAALLGFFLTAWAEPPDSIPDPRLTNHSAVHDGAQVLSNFDELRIDNAINDLEDKTGAQMMVVTVQTLDGLSIEEWSNTLFKRIGIGHKGKNDGALFVFAMSDRRSRLEVGYGLEDVLTEERSKAILNDQIAPAFRKQQYAQGILEGISVTTNYIKGASPPAVNRASTGLGKSGVGLGIVGALIVGGAGLLLLRKRPRRCPNCKGELSHEEAPLSELTEGQQCEKQLKSRVFTRVSCAKCGFSELDIKAADPRKVNAINCRKCGNCTARVHLYTQKPATYKAEGREKVVEKCNLPSCKHNHAYERPIPIQTPPKRSGSAGSSGGWSESGGYSDSGSSGGGDSGGGGSGSW